MRFYEVDNSDVFSTVYKFDGIRETDDFIDAQCKEYLEQGRRNKVMGLTDAGVLVLQAAINDGRVKGYEFFNNLDEFGRWEWVGDALRKYCRLNRKEPENYPPVTFFELLDAVRAYRKEQKKLREEAKKSEGTTKLTKMKPE